RSPGFEPGLSAWEADVLTKLDYDRIRLDLAVLLPTWTFIYTYLESMKNCAIVLFIFKRNPHVEVYLGLEKSQSDFCVFRI
ncbi:MAG: hypothetical protein PVH12_05235, partial [Candidatus Bathyarchaeota archaeon]